MSTVSLPKYRDCRFFLVCLMSFEVMVLSLVFDLQFAGECRSFWTIFFGKIDLYLPELCFMLRINVVMFE